MNQLTSKIIMSMIQENMQKISGYGVRRIGLFGSYLREANHSKSDVDILVEFEVGRKTFDNYMELKFFLEDLFMRPVDLVISEAVKSDLKPSIFGSVTYAAGI